ncbi:MAG: TonB-dependent receptor [Xanthomonadales bacterium]|nr:TonB-dependent receptor [Xanthomonadales bacterium]
MLTHLIPALLLQGSFTVNEAPARLDPLEIRATGAQQELGSIPGISLLTREDIDLEAATHPNELFDRVPGTWISRGSGQESLMSIRSPVLTGPGACGAFMVMEDRVPIRPAGFCNVNELFEVNLLQARRVDVVRGPGSVIYGSNALHGVIDVTSQDASDGQGLRGGFMLGSDDYQRYRGALYGEHVALLANYTDAGSFRDDEGYRQWFANGSWDAEIAGATVRSQFSWARLDQDTAGFIFGFEAYKDPVLRTENLNPEAFRKVRALRASSRWTWQNAAGQTLELIPYLRNSEMDFLQHFLPGKPLETNGQTSAGALLSWAPDSHWRLGADFEWADGDLVEFQDQPTQGSPFLVETRPQGFHYDYQVRMLMAAAWAQYQRTFTSGLRLTAGLRAERIAYRYDNRMIDGNTRDDGTPCGFGGCLYTRPADRSDRFDTLAPELGLSWPLGDRLELTGRIARGFRPPQATELYRLQRGQQVADLDSETLDSAELGLRHTGSQLRWDLTLFVMRKDEVISRDANGFNVSGGRTTHRGVEAAVDWQFLPRWRFNANISYAIHEYDFERLASGIVPGNEVDTAPPWLGGARLHYEPSGPLSGELEWVYTGAYYLDPANEHRYGGHDLLNLRVFYHLPASAGTLALRVSNLADALYAERADFAFGNYRYFPGAERRYFLEWRYAP